MDVRVPPAGLGRADPVLRAGGGLVLRLRIAEGSPPADVDIDVVDAETGEPLVTHHSTSRPVLVDGELPLPSVPVGYWRVTVRTYDGRSGEVEVRLPPADPAERDGV